MLKKYDYAVFIGFLKKLFYFIEQKFHIKSGYFLTKFTLKSNFS
jgi:hypothetical protein